MWRVLVIAMAVTAIHSSLEGQSIFTFAGGGTDDGRPALSTPMDPTSITFDHEGNLFFIESGGGGRVRKISSRSQLVQAFAGNGSASFSGDGGPAVSAGLQLPTGLVADSAGNIYIADRNNYRVRRVEVSTGVITTVAGADPVPEPGIGDGLPATASGVLIVPQGVAFDLQGRLLIADRVAHRIRRVNENGIIQTIVGNGSRTVDGMYGGDGGPALQAQLNAPERVITDRAGHLYISDTYNHRVRRVDAITQIITTIAGNGVGANTGDGGLATAASLMRPGGLVFDRDGNLLIASAGALRKVDLTTGIISTPPAARTMNPRDLAGWRDEIYVSSAYRIWRMPHGEGSATVVAGSGSVEFTGDGGPATAARLHLPAGITTDEAGNVYIASFRGIRRVDARSRMITTMGAGTYTSVFWSKERLYASSHLSHEVWRLDPKTGQRFKLAGSGAAGYSGDGGPATSAVFDSPTSVVADRPGNVYIADRNNHRVRRIDTVTGIVSTYAGTGTPGFSGDFGPAVSAAIFGPTGLAIDADDNLYIADSFNNRVRRVSSLDKTITTIAGNGLSAQPSDDLPATMTTLMQPGALALDRTGNLFIGEYGAQRIRRVSPAGIISAYVAQFVPGKPAYGYSGDGGPALLAQTTVTQNFFSGIATNPAGDLYIGDTYNDRVRVVYACVPVPNATLRHPSTASSGLSLAPLLSWVPVAGAFAYDVYLDTVEPPRQIAANDVSTTSYSPANLEPLMKYYWKVVAKGDPFCVPFSYAGSEVWSFTTTGTCSPPGVFESNSTIRQEHSR